MLTKELLQQNDALSALTDEQIGVIENLSRNDENQVIGNRFGEVYRTFDENISKASGIQRDGDEKTYVYLDRVLGSLKSGKTEAEKQVADLTKEVARLNKVIADGSADSESKKALAQAQKDLQSITSQYNTLKADHDQSEERHRKELFSLQIDAELGSAKTGLKIKPGIPQTVSDIIIRQATQAVKEMNPGYIDDGKGGKVLAFKDKDGAVLRNPENQLNPYTAGELLRSELKKMGILDDGVHQTGTGTRAEEGGGTDGAVDVSGARNQQEAYDIISKQLLRQGLVNGSQRFQEAMNEAWKTNNVASLPKA